MLDFIDRFAAPRYRADPQLRCASIWVGTVSSKKALNAYLSPGSPERAQFVKDAGDDWYDHDFLDAQKQRSPRPAAEVITELAQSYDLPAEATSRLIDASRERGLVEANAWIVLAQHTYEGDETVDFHGFCFLATVEYRTPPPPLTERLTHLFVGVTTLPTLADMRSYVVDGALATEVGVQLEDDQYYGYELRTGDARLSVRDFFDLPIVRHRIVLDVVIDEVERACRDRGLDSINAFMSGTAGDGEPPLPIAAEQRFAGLHYLGAFPSAHIF